MSQLTDEQRKRIEENRRKALEKRAAKLASEATNRAPSSHNGGTSETKIESGSSNGNNFFQPPAKIFDSNVSKVNNFFQPKAKIFESNGDNRYQPTAKVFKSGPNFKNNNSSSFNSDKPKTSNVQLRGNCVCLSRNVFFVNIGYNKEVIDAFKTIPSRSYDAQTKKWNFNMEDHDRLITALKPLQPNVIICPLPKLLVKTLSSAPVEAKEHDLSSLDPVLLNALLPFQKEGVNFGIQHNGRVLIADDMGLGKTIQAIAIADYYRKDWPLLVVMPSSVRYSWADAFQTWLPSLDAQEITVINNGKDHIPNNQVILMSYDMLAKKKDEIIKRKFKSVIMDESHFLKNSKTSRTKAAQIVMKSMKRIIMLSGTPALSRPIELYTQISALLPHNKFFPYLEFGSRYCNGSMKSWGWDFSGSSNMEELKLLLEETVMIRRLKSEVIKQLPSKVRQVIILDPSKIATKSKVLKCMSKKLSQSQLKGMERRGVLLEYFHESGVVKLNAICEYVSDLLESDKKFICFAHHQIVMAGICETVEKTKTNYIRIDGSVNSEQRKNLCDKFQLNDSYKVAVLSITAANLGITLTAASLVVFAELFWNPGILTQAEDRAHRIGQENSVLVQYLVARGTADDEIWPLVQKKLDILNKAGLSKDNFKTADCIDAAETTQSCLEDFWSCIEDSLELDETPTKRSKVDVYEF